MAFQIDIALLLNQLFYAFDGIGEEEKQYWIKYTADKVKMKERRRKS